MKMFVRYTLGTAFQEMWSHFSTSVKERTSFTLCAEPLPEHFDGVHYGQEHYVELLRYLVEWRQRLVRTETEPFVTAGIDAEFFGDPVKDIEARIATHDLVGADDNPTVHRICSCLYAIQPRRAVDDLFQKVLDDPLFGFGPGKDTDDPSLNRHRDMVRWQALPHNLYWNTLGLWNIGDPEPMPPREMLWFHANYTIGLDNKLALLRAVRRVVESKR